jgi:membrane-bound metal-dependent hydrolase YbcI (DUF457 family)
MKGLTHFVVGAAVASCFPQAAELTIMHQSLILALGGVFGILPDTLDFKLAMFIEENDYIIDPATKEFLKDPMNMNSTDPQRVAAKIAQAIDEAWDTGREIRLQLHTVQVAGDLWRHYEVFYDTVNNEVVAELGPTVTMSQVPTEFPKIPRDFKEEGRAKTKCNILQTQKRASRVDIFNGPSFGYMRKGDEGVEIIFLPWHRQWSHSPAMAIIFGALGWFIFGKIYGLVIGLAFLAHILLDLTGFMGANLAWPIRQRRTTGGQFLKASNPIANFLVIWFSGILVLWNLNNFSPKPTFHLHAWPYFGYFFLIPTFLLMATTRVLEMRGTIIEIFKREGFGALGKILLLLILGKEWQEKIRIAKGELNPLKRIGKILLAIIRMVMREVRPEAASQMRADEEVMESEEEFAG